MTTPGFFNTIFSWFGFGFGNTTAGRSFYRLPGGTGTDSAPPVNLATSDAGKDVTARGILQISSAWACVWLIANAVATLPLSIMRRDEDDMGQPDKTNPLYTLLHDQPNSDMTACEYLQMQIASLLVWGNGYSEIGRVGKRTTALWPLRSEYMTPYRTKEGNIRYAYQHPTQGKDYAQEEIFHIKDRTLDGLVGLSRIEYARNSFGLAIATDEASGKTFANGLRSSGFLQASNWLTPTQREQIKTTLTDFSGSGNQGKIMTLEGGMNFHALSMKPMDAELLASRGFSVEDICRWYGVQPFMIGHMEKTTSWGTGIESMNLGFLTYTLRAILVGIEQAVKRQLIPAGERLDTWAEFNLEGLLRADSAGRAAFYSTMVQNGLMQRSEVRRKENLPMVDGSDILTVQSNLVPLDKLGEADPLLQALSNVAAG